MRHFSNALDGDWNRVTGTAPCPVCGGDANCRTHSDEAFVCCVQRPSDWRLNNGGWLHRLQVSSAVVPGSVIPGAVVPGSVFPGHGLASAELRRVGAGPSGATP
jgi:hypothetical protein